MQLNGAGGELSVRCVLGAWRAPVALRWECMDLFLPEGQCVLPSAAVLLVRWAWGVNQGNIPLLGSFFFVPFALPGWEKRDFGSCWGWEPSLSPRAPGQLQALSHPLGMKGSRGGRSPRALHVAFL